MSVVEPVERQSIHPAYPVIGLARFVVIEPRQSVREDAPASWSIEDYGDVLGCAVEAVFERSGFSIEVRLHRAVGEQAAPASHLFLISTKPLAPRDGAVLDVGSPTTWERGNRQDLRAWRAPVAPGRMKIGLQPGFELLHRDCIRHCEFLGIPIRHADGRSGVITFVVNAAARENLRVALEARPIQAGVTKQ